MEKRTYIIPAMKARRIKTPSLLSGSENLKIDGENTTPTQRAKEGNGFGWGNDEEESEDY